MDLNNKKVKEKRLFLRKFNFQQSQFCFFGLTQKQITLDT